MALLLVRRHLWLGRELTGAAKFASWCKAGALIKKKEKREKKKIVQRVALCRIPSQKERETLLQDVLLVFSYLNVSFRPTP
jgi:hypothetical protein